MSMSHSVDISLTAPRVFFFQARIFSPGAFVGLNFQEFDDVASANNVPDPTGIYLALFLCFVFLVVWEFRYEGRVELKRIQLQTSWQKRYYVHPRQ